MSVVVTTYNHEKYIAQCLENILSQKGDFQLEVVVGDDCSTDNTSWIVDDFRDSYPTIITMLPREKNLGITKNLKRCLDACSGEYIAICEGDDYWLDEYKLQKQMMYLETHPDLSMCFSAFYIYYEDKNLFKPHVDQLLLRKDVLKTEDLILNNYIGNFSCCMYRGEVVKQLPENLYEIFTVDWLFNMTCGQFGDIGFLRERMSVYRKHSQGAWSGMNELIKLKELLRLIDVYNNFFSYKYDKQFMQFKAVVVHEIVLYSRQYEIPDLSTNKLALKDKLKLAYNFFLSSYRKLRSLPRILYARIYTAKEQFVNKTNPPVKPTPKTNFDLLILDTIFPHPLSAFRFEEFTEYLNRFPKSIVLTNGEHLHLLKETRSLDELIDEYEITRPDLRSRVKVAPPLLTDYHPKLAYLTFLNNVLVFIDRLEKEEIPFIFTLYPGGGFAVNNESVGRSLWRVMKSPQFRKVIVTQKITYNYLINGQFCTPEQVEFIYGVVTPSALLKKEIGSKQCFGIDKDTLDICFVAHKYTSSGQDKGYDIFLETAKKLSSHYTNIQFHVVGGFTESDLPLDGIENRITFYGLQKPEWFDDFYSDKDIILSPNIPFRLHEGSFDGFPTASCTEAGLRGVAIFCTDELDLNIKFTHNEDIVIVPHNSDMIVKTIQYFYANPEKLKALAEKGAVTIREVYSFENQILPRVKILKQEIAKY